MKKVRIHISKLGPIVDQEIELAQLMLFTGDSNLGKSYTNFLCYYLFYLAVADRLDDFLAGRLQGYDDSVTHCEFSLKKDDIRLWMESDVKRFYQYLLAYPDIECDVHFYFDDAPDIIDVSIREQADPNDESNALVVNLVINGYAVNFRITKGIKKNEVISWIKPFLLRELTGKLIFNTLLMPPGRASLLSGSFSTQKSSSKTGLYDIFLSDNDRINFRALRGTSLKEDPQFFLSRIRKLIGGDIISGKNGLELKLENGQTLPIEATASSIKELSPILMWIKGATNMNYESICIEEPEAHCHPMMQAQLGDLLVACINKGALMQITTHSDYLLKRLNQLLRLNDLSIESPERYNSYCERFEHTRSLVLNKDVVKAYYFSYSEVDKNVRIELQDLTNGIPFDSFSKIIDDEIEFDNFIEGEDADL